MNLGKMWLTAIVMASGLLVTPARAGEIVLAWDSVPGATSYKVYYGPSSGSYTQSVTTSSPTATVTGLADCTNWFLAVKAVNSAGESTGYSNEVSGWPRPAVTGISPTSAMQGDQLLIDISGTNFQSGAVVDMGDPKIIVGSAQVTSCRSMQVLTTLEPRAANQKPAKVGNVKVTIENPDSVFGDRSDVFRVNIDPGRFDVNKADDFTRDRIDGKDTVWLSRMFGLVETDATYDPDFDFDGDGWIDGEDLAYLASNLGSCWTGSAWTVAACPASLR